MRNEETDWMHEKMPDVQAPPPKILYKGPDAMRLDSGTGGHGDAFIFFPDGHLEWAPGGNHDAIIDPGSDASGLDKTIDLLSRAFTDKEIEDLGVESSYRGQPFFENHIIRFKLQQRALFGRVGRVSGYDMLSLWPGTENFTRLLPELVDRLEKQGKIREDTLITVGREARYTVGQFLHKRAEVTAKLHAASSSLGDVLKRKTPIFQPGQGDAENMANPLQKGIAPPKEPLASASPGQKWWAPTSESFGEYVRKRDGAT